MPWQREVAGHKLGHAGGAPLRLSMDVRVGTQELLDRNYGAACSVLYSMSERLRQDEDVSLGEGGFGARSFNCDTAATLANRIEGDDPVGDLDSPRGAQVKLLKDFTLKGAVPKGLREGVEIGGFRAEQGGHAGLTGQARALMKYHCGVVCDGRFAKMRSQTKLLGRIGPIKVTLRKKEPPGTKY
jgi:hypothetical protein